MLPMTPISSASGMNRPGGMRPADQRLDADHLAVVQAQLRLVDQLELLLIDGLAQGLLQTQALLCMAGHAFGMEAEGIAVLLGLIQGHVGVAQQVIGVVGILGVEADADAGSDVDAAPGDLERGEEGVEDGLCATRGFVGISAHQHDEFVAAHARHRVDGGGELA
jgi:hypothetical protein